MLPLYDTVFLVGSGAEDGSWQPITNAIRRADRHAPVGDANADHANFWMAKLIALRRAAFAAKGRDANVTNSWVEDMHQRLRENICEELASAESSGSLTLRDSFRAVIGRPDWGTHRVVLTTNWDHLAERVVRAEVKHIHGSISEWKSLFLPTDYSFDPSHAAETREQMYEAQDKAIRYLWRARQVCIFGLSLDPLDAELALIVATGLRHAPSLERICIVNRESEEKKLRDRVALLAPADLRASIDFEAV